MRTLLLRFRRGSPIASRINNFLILILSISETTILWCSWLYWPALLLFLKTFLVLQ